MDKIYVLTIPQLLISLIPILIVAVIYLYWSVSIKDILYSTVRMVGQLILIGFFLIFLFKKSQPWHLGLVILAMMSIASWIALRPLETQRKDFFLQSFLAILVSGAFCLALTFIFIVHPKPWYDPKYVITISGMILANSMNGLSLAAERFESELKKQTDYDYEPCFWRVGDSGCYLSFSQNT